MSESLRRAFRREVPRGARWSWDYIAHTRSAVDREALTVYHGPRDLEHWLRNQFDDLGHARKPKRIDHWLNWPADVAGLIHDASLLHLRLQGGFDALLSVDTTPWAIYTAQDYHYSSSLIRRPARVLDWGAGYGRQAMLWARASTWAQYIALDAVEQSYCLQAWAFARLGLRVDERLGRSPESSDAVVHMPAWTATGLRAGSVDLILFVWSLHEMSRQGAWWALRQARRLLRPGGALYIRDAGSPWWSPERALTLWGFRCVWASDPGALHGRIRLWMAP